MQMLHKIITCTEMVILAIVYKARIRLSILMVLAHAWLNFTMHVATHAISVVLIAHNNCSTLWNNSISSYVQEWLATK
jgi:hypothetical protein